MLRLTKQTCSPQSPFSPSPSSSKSIAHQRKYGRPTDEFHFEPAPFDFGRSMLHECSERLKERSPMGSASRS